MMLHANRRPAPPSARQRGVATLIVVLVLFFVISLVAAYTNRNLIFEQRTASNQYRSTQAFQAAEAGVEWAVSMLNQGRITDTCEASTDAADLSFRQRYLVADNTGRIAPRDNGSGGPISAACVFNGTGWTCNCPSTTEATVSSPGTNGLFPAFMVRFIRVYNADLTPAAGPARQPGVVQVQVVGCTRADVAGSGDQCLQFDGQGALSEGRAVIDQLLALTGGPSSLPAAALTARGRVQVGGGTGFSASNNLPGGSGITVQAGGTVGGDFDKIVSQPGTPGGSASFLAGDSALSGLTAGTAAVSNNAISSVDRMFAAVFNMRPTMFQQQPAALICNPSDCPNLAAKASQNPGRPIWFDGDLDVSGVLGSANEPIALVVNGNLTFSGSSGLIYGLVYVRVRSTETRWETAGSGQINGATVCDKDIEGASTLTFVNDPAVLGRMRWTIGSFVRVPSSWRDWKDPLI